MLALNLTKLSPSTRNEAVAAADLFQTLSNVFKAIADGEPESFRARLNELSALPKDSFIWPAVGEAITSAAWACSAEQRAELERLFTEIVLAFTETRL